MRPAEAQAISTLLQILLLLELLENAISMYFEFGSNWVIFDVSLAAQRVSTVHSMYSRGVESNISVLDVTYLSGGSRPKGLVCCGVRLCD